MEFTPGELRGRGITQDALHTTLSLQGYGKISELIAENKTFYLEEERLQNGNVHFIKRNVGASLVKKKGTDFSKFDLAVSLFAKELITRANHDVIYMPLTDFWDIMEGEEYNNYIPAAHTVLCDFQDEGPSPYVGKDGIRLRKRIEWTIMRAIKMGRAFTIATQTQVSGCDWYTDSFRSFLKNNLVKYEL